MPVQGITRNWRSRTRRIGPGRVGRAVGGGQISGEPQARDDLVLYHGEANERRALRLVEVAADGILNGGTKLLE